MAWKLSQDGKTASRILDNGATESSLISAIDADELAAALPADPLSQEQIITAAKIVRDNALNALAHDFGDGRIIQTRPKDESNIRNAIEIMEANNIPSIGWSMIDDVKQAVTAVELREALAAGQLAAMTIWDAYNP